MLDTTAEPFTERARATAEVCDSYVRLREAEQGVLDFQEIYAASWLAPRP